MALKVLTVDDSKTIRMIVKKAFQPYYCEVVEAENGVEGLAAATKVKPGLIILRKTFFLIPIAAFVVQIMGFRPHNGLDIRPFFIFRVVLCNSPLVENGKVHVRKVDIAHNNGIAAEVRSGLSPAESVIVYLPDSLNDGAAVAADSKGSHG